MKMLPLGKSSLVNGIRRIPEADPRAAVVGEIETTMKPTQYPHPEISNFVLWDIPGAGTASHPISTYFEKNCLIAFDVLVINCE